MPRFALFPLLLLLAALNLAAAEPAVREPWFGIRVVDAATGRGVPLVELRTVNDIALVTDSGGWAAFHEPELMGREVFFRVSSPGYELPADGFGTRGVRLVTTPGQSAVVKLPRTNIAERACRITGQGIHREAELLGVPHPEKLTNLPGGVLGQDSVQCVPYRGGLFWMWGDTNVPGYPLGNFHMTGATSPLPGPETFRPAEGVPLTYFADPRDPARPRKMAPLEGPGVVWLFGALTLADPDGKEALVAHYSRRKGLGEQYEQGLVRLDDEAGIFRKVKMLELSNAWRYPRGNAVRVTGDGTDYFYFCFPFADSRVRADWQSLLDPAAYEAFAFDPETKAYRWRKDADPTTQADEARRIPAGQLAADAARYRVVEAATGKAIRIHRASIEYSAFRKRWILIGNEEGGRDAPSYLGEVWYAEADDVTGPWRKAVKLATHPRYSFYNPRQHPAFAEEQGRVLYFEGTYTQTFSGSGPPTPRYEYNQLLYRLDLSDPRLAAAR